MELSLEQVLEGLEAAAAHHAGSLAVPLDDGDGEAGTLADTLGVDDAGFALAEDRATVVAAMHRLSVREQHVLRLRFFEDRTQAEIAELIGVSQMQVSRCCAGQSPSSPSTRNPTRPRRATNRWRSHSEAWFAPERSAQRRGPLPVTHVSGQAAIGRSTPRSTNSR